MASFGGLAYHAKNQALAHLTVDLPKPPTPGAPYVSRATRPAVRTFETHFPTMLPPPGPSWLVLSPEFEPPSGVLPPAAPLPGAPPAGLDTAPPAPASTVVLVAVTTEGVCNPPPSSPQETDRPTNAKKTAHAALRRLPGIGRWLSKPGPRATLGMTACTRRRMIGNCDAGTQRTCQAAPRMA